MDNNTTIAYMCQNCGDFSVFCINIFEFSGNRKKIVACECGESNLTIVKNSNKSFKVDTMCPICNDMHSYVIQKNQFWSDEVFTFSCPFYEANILFVGKGGKVEEMIKDYMEEEMITEDKPMFFPEYEILKQVVSLVKFIEEHPGDLQICSCENSSLTTAYNERFLYIICENCNHAFPIEFTDVDKYMPKQSN